MVRSRRATLAKLASLPGRRLPQGSQGRAFGPNLSDAGFHGETRLTVPSRFTNTVAAIIAVGTLSLCVGVTIAVLSIKAAMSIPT